MDRISFKKYFRANKRLKVWERDDVLKGIQRTIEKEDLTSQELIQFLRLWAEVSRTDVQVFSTQQNHVICLPSHDPHWEREALQRSQEILDATQRNLPAVDDTIGGATDRLVTST